MYRLGPTTVFFVQSPANIKCLQNLETHKQHWIQHLCFTKAVKARQPRWFCQFFIVLCTAGLQNDTKAKPFQYKWTYCVQMSIIVRKLAYQCLDKKALFHNMQLFPKKLLEYFSLKRAFKHPFTEMTYLYLVVELQLSKIFCFFFFHTHNWILIPESNHLIAWLCSSF